MLQINSIEKPYPIIRFLELLGGAPSDPAGFGVSDPAGFAVSDPAGLSASFDPSDWESAHPDGISYADEFRYLPDGFLCGMLLTWQRRTFL